MAAEGDELRFADAQYEMHAIEALGLLKFDFLGLSNLTILKNAVHLTRAKVLSTGETTGIVQLESAGMRRYVRELRPRTSSSSRGTGSTRLTPCATG
jgi:DNA polymerase-3 subunit alpha